MPKVILFFISSVLLVASMSFMEPKGEKVKWLTVAEMQAAYSKNPKPILVDVYTTWCGWCKVMDKQTYSHERWLPISTKNIMRLSLMQKARSLLNGTESNTPTMNKIR
jgi:thiol:disulfide interchange protein